jgi:hypothetical protein
MDATPHATAILLFFVASASAARAGGLFIGETWIPLGGDAFPSRVACLDPEGCGAEILPLGPPPLFPFRAMADAFGFEHLLEVVAVDLDAGDEVHLEFEVPLRNDPGPDVYVAQAVFAGALSVGDPTGLAPFFLRLQGGSEWHEIGVQRFEPDAVLGPRTIYYGDPEIRSDAYRLWFATLDLDELGGVPAEGASILRLRGPELQGVPETRGLDAVTVASLRPAPEPDAWIEGIVAIAGLRVLARRPPPARHRLVGDASVGEAAA